MGLNFETARPRQDVRRLLHILERIYDRSSTRAVCGVWRDARQFRPEAADAPAAAKLSLGRSCRLLSNDQRDFMRADAASAYGFGHLCEIRIP